MTRIYRNCKEAMGEIKRNLYEMGIRAWPMSYQNKDIHDNPDFATMELQAETFTIVDSSDKNDMIAFEYDSKIKKLQKILAVKYGNNNDAITKKIETLKAERELFVNNEIAWCNAEFAERISREEMNPGTAWKLRENVWKEFLNEKGEQDYTYAERMMGQIDKVIAELKRNPESRQTIISIHNSLADVDSMGGKERIPCSMFYQFMVRKDVNEDPKLNIVYVMRSSDYYTHFKNDIWLACELRDYIAKEIGVAAGTFTMFVSSLHMYKKDMEDNVY